MMRQMISLFAMLLGTVNATADITNCQDLYVGRIWIEKGSGALHAVVFLNSPSDIGGSYWVFFSEWTQDEEKATLALFTAAKIAQHRVNLVTTEPGACGINFGGTLAKSIYLANNP